MRFSARLEFSLEWPKWEKEASAVIVPLWISENKQKNAFGLFDATGAYLRHKV